MILYCWDIPKFDTDHCSSCHHDFEEGYSDLSDEELFGVEIHSCCSCNIQFLTHDQVKEALRAKREKYGC